MKLKIIILVICSFVALAAGFLPSFSQVEWAYQNLTWFFMLFVTVALIITLCKVIAAQEVSLEVPPVLKKHILAPVAAFLLITCAALLSPPEFKILADETNLLGVSLEMHENMQTRLPLEVLYFYHGMHTDISHKTEMRPPGYAFALSLVHNLCGYRPANAFVLNLTLAWMSLLLIYALVARHARRLWAFAAMFGLAAFPVFVQCATSAGFETYNLTLALATFLLLDLYMAGKSTSLAVIVCMCLLAYSRYESILALVCFVPLLLATPDREDDSGRLAAWGFPLLLLPAIWLRRLTFNATSFQVDNLEEAFSTNHFMTNLSGYLQYFTSSGFTRFAGPVLLAIAVAGLLAWVHTLSDKGKSRSSKLFELSLALFFVLHLAARLFYTQGNPMNAYTTRLTLIFLPAIVLLATFALKRLEIRWFLHSSADTTRQNSTAGQIVIDTHPHLARQSKMAFASAGLMLLLLITSWPAASANSGVNYLSLYREFKWVRDQLTTVGAGIDSIVITNRPNMYVPFRFSAVTPEYTQKNAASFLSMLKICAYRRLILIETITYADQQSSLPTIPEFSTLKQQVIFETQLTGKDRLKITALTL